MCAGGRGGPRGGQLVGWEPASLAGPGHNGDGLTGGGPLLTPHLEGGGHIQPYGSSYGFNRHVMPPHGCLLPTESTHVGSARGVDLQAWARPKLTSAGSARGGMDLRNGGSAQGGTYCVSSVKHSCQSQSGGESQSPAKRTLSSRPHRSLCALQVSRPKLKAYQQQASARLHGGTTACGHLGPTKRVVPMDFTTFLVDFKNDV